MLLHFHFCKQLRQQICCQFVCGLWTMCTELSTYFSRMKGFRFNELKFFVHHRIDCQFAELKEISLSSPQLAVCILYVGQQVCCSMQNWRPWYSSAMHKEGATVFCFLVRHLCSPHLISVWNTTSGSFRLLAIITSTPCHHLVYWSHSRLSFRLIRFVTSRKRRTILPAYRWVFAMLTWNGGRLSLSIHCLPSLEWL